MLCSEYIFNIPLASHSSKSPKRWLLYTDIPLHLTQNASASPCFPFPWVFLCQKLDQPCITELVPPPPTCCNTRWFPGNYLDCRWSSLQRQMFSIILLSRGNRKHISKWRSDFMELGQSLIQKWLLRTSAVGWSAVSGGQRSRVWLLPSSAGEMGSPRKQRYRED